MERTKILARLPYAGRMVPEFNDPLVRELILKPYRIVYRIDETQKRVGIARFWHGHRHALDSDGVA